MPRCACEASADQVPTAFPASLGTAAVVAPALAAAPDVKALATASAPSQLPNAPQESASQAGHEKPNELVQQLLASGQDGLSRQPHQVQQFLQQQYLQQQQLQAEQLRQQQQVQHLHQLHQLMRAPPASASVSAAQLAALTSPAHDAMAALLPREFQRGAIPGAAVPRPRKRTRARRACAVPGCDKSAAQGTAKCKGHGGGRRCSHPGCKKSAQGSTPLCVQHGGGKRCQYPGGCHKVARGSTNFCVAHGGGYRCMHHGCNRGARGKSGFCKAHGAGGGCVEGCQRYAQSDGFCTAHSQLYTGLTQANPTAAGLLGIAGGVRSHVATPGVHDTLGVAGAVHGFGAVLDMLTPMSSANAQAMLGAATAAAAPAQAPAPPSLSALAAEPAKRPPK